METGVHFGFKLNTYAQREDTPFTEYLELAGLAEKLGFEWTYVVDHLSLPGDFSAAGSTDGPKPYVLDAWTSLAAISSSTKAIRVGTQVSPFTINQPARLAKIAATVDVISGGRLDVGIGTGHNNPHEYLPYGLPFTGGYKERCEMMDEGLEILIRLWTEGGPVSFSGKHYTLKGAFSCPRPLQKPHPPILLGGTSPRILEIAGKKADGWAPAMPMFPNGMPPEVYRRSLEKIQAVGKSSGRDLSRFRAGALFFVCISEHRENAYDLATQVMKGKNWAPSEVEGLIAQGSIIAGDPDDCVGEIERYVKAGCAYFTLSFMPLAPTLRTKEALTLFSKKVFPHFGRRKGPQP